jgi:pyruvate dehydrogenase E1 component alpha subunit
VGILGTVPLVGATIPLATGAGLAYKIQNQARVAVAFLGDGATEEGVFHESMNLAAAHRLPVVFVVENNLFASHLQILERRAQDNIVLSAAAHGMPGEVLDGNDAQAVRMAALEAVARARNGQGPTLLEARTFRWRGHVGPSWDMDVGVQRNDMLQEWLPRDPIAQTRTRLLDLGAKPEELDALVGQARAEVDASVRFGEESPYPDPETVADHVFVNN